MIHEIWGQLTPSLLINIWTLHKVPCTIFFVFCKMTKLLHIQKIFTCAHHSLPSSFHKEWISRLMKIKMVCGFNNISWLRFNLAPLTNEQQRAELGRSWSRCLSWGEWDKLWRAESSWAADSSCRHIMEMWGILPPAPLTSWFIVAVSWKLALSEL